MKFYCLFVLVLAIVFTSCDKEMDKKPDQTIAPPKNPFSNQLLKKADNYAVGKGWIFFPKSDSLVFIEMKYAPMPTDLQAYIKSSDSVSRDLVKKVYVESIDRLPDDYRTQRGTMYVDMLNGYFYVTYDGVNYRYYSTAGPTYGMPNGRNPFALITIFEDTIQANNSGMLYRGYNPTSM